MFSAKVVQNYVRQNLCVKICFQNLCMRLFSSINLSSHIYLPKIDSKINSKYLYPNFHHNILAQDILSAEHDSLTTISTNNKQVNKTIWQKVTIIISSWPVFGSSCTIIIFSTVVQSCKKSGSNLLCLWLSYRSILVVVQVTHWVLGVISHHTWSRSAEISHGYGPT